ncbi:hypothetical protein D5086_026331 [Populus alba]|uniref:Uncharacterized protein n=1 Tax=Populus alba TaxID=43335 RepID=A0ACC4B1L5_POPAL
MVDNVGNNNSDREWLKYDLAGGSTSDDGIIKEQDREVEGERASHSKASNSEEKDESSRYRGESMILKATVSPHTPLKLPGNIDRSNGLSRRF